MRYSTLTATTATLLTIVSPQSAMARAHARPPQPVEDPASWFHPDDYPAAAMRKAEQGTVAVLLAVDAEGRVTDCRIEHSSGFADLDAGTCLRLQRRAHFQPAREAQGQPVAGVYEHSVVWRQPS